MAGFAEGLMAEGFNMFGNIANGYAAEMFQDRYMQRWGSPEAQMEHMRNAGINPYSAAGQVSGAAGNSNVQAAQAAPDLSGSVEAASNVDKNEHDNANTDADTKGKQLDNEVKEDTLEYQKQTIIDNARKAGADADTARIIADNQQEILSLTKDKMQSEINKLDQEEKNLKKQVELYDEQINSLKQQIEESKAREKLLIAEEELTRQKQYTEQLQQQMMGLEIKKGEIDLELKSLGSDADPAVAQCRRIKEKVLKEGKSEEEAEAEAVKWLEESQEIVRNSVKAQEEERVEADPVRSTQKNNKEYYDDQIADVDDQIKDLQIKRNNASTETMRQRYNDEINSLQSKRRRLTRQRNRAIRRVGKGVSGGVNIMGTGANFGS